MRTRLVIEWKVFKGRDSDKSGYYHRDKNGVPTIAIDSSIGLIDQFSTLIHEIIHFWIDHIMKEAVISIEDEEKLCEWMRDQAVVMIKRFIRMVFYGENK